jgi:ethanolamine kinase
MDSKPTNGHSAPLRRISLSYNNSESEDSALRLAYAIEPKWREEEGEIEVTKFTDGITNNVSSGPGLSMVGLG